MITLFIFILGACIGSFLNVVIYRYNTGMSINGRSQCFSCGRTLVWYDLIPIFSFLFAGGRCRVCKAKISWQYPLVELATALLFLGLYLHDGLSALLSIDLIIWSILMVITVYDLRHKIIPDGFVAAFIILGLIRLFMTVPFVQVFHQPHLWDLLAGIIFFIPFYLLWYLSKGTWMGLGDGKLAIGMGTLLGLKYGLSAIILGFWIGAVFSIIYLCFGRNNLTMKSELPFAPFLILGILIVFFTHFDALMIGTLL